MGYDHPNMYYLTKLDSQRKTYSRTGVTTSSLTSVKRSSQPVIPTLKQVSHTPIFKNQDKSEEANKKAESD